MLDTPPEEPDRDPVSLKKIDGYVVLDHVNFGYTPEVTVLHDLSLYARPGQKIAFVGSTGAGKTTVTNLLSRFYDVQEGTITIDGVPIEKIDRSFLRKNIAMVLQDTHLFHRDGPGKHPLWTAGRHGRRGAGGREDRFGPFLYRTAGAWL